MKTFACALSFLFLAACSKSGAPPPSQAAAQMEQAFANAAPPTKALVGQVSEALRAGEYESAVVSLTTIQSAPASTPEQHQAIQNSAMALESQLLRAIQAGDKKAEASYKLLKELKRN